MIVALQKVKKTLSNSISEPSLNTAGRKGPPALNTNGPEDACEPWEETQFQNIAALQQSGRDLIRSISSEIWRALHVIALLLVRIGSAQQAVHLTHRVDLSLLRLYIRLRHPEGLPQSDIR